MNWKAPIIVVLILTKIDEAIVYKKWCVILFHSVGDSKILDYIKSKAVPVLTVWQALK